MSTRGVVFNFAGRVDIVVDVAGFLTTGFTPAGPSRIGKYRVGPRASVAVLALDGTGGAPAVVNLPRPG